MTGVIDGVDRRTQLVGGNRLELLLFRLSGTQRFGINVFKVREVIRCPPLTRLPQSHPVVRGIAHMRESTITVVDLAMAIGRPAVPDVSQAFVILTEFNRSVQGFLVGGVDRIVNMNWEDVLPPPKGTGRHNYMTAVTRIDEELIEIIDVEKVLAEVTGVQNEVSEQLLEESTIASERTPKVLIADDSSVARRQIARTLDQVGVEYVTVQDGREALELLQGWADDGGSPVPERLSMVISDVEMPEMDGYTLTKEIKEDPRLQDLFVLLHTSLSGVFNSSMVEKVGADLFVPKFNADELARAVVEQIGAPAPTGGA